MSFALWRDRLVLAILALLPWQARYIKEPAELMGVPWEQGTIAVFALEVLLLAALVCHLLARASGSESKKYVAPIWFQIAALIPAYAFISVFWAFDKIGAILSAIHLLEGYVLAYLIWVSALRLAPLLTAFVLGVASTSILGVWQVLTQTSFSSSWLGIALHEAGQSGVSVVETSSGRYLRAYGTLPHPNVLGGYAAAGLVACLALFSEAKRHRRLLLFLTAVISVALVLTFSRSAWIATLFAMGLAFTLPNAVDKSTRLGLRPIVTCIILCVASVAFICAPLIAPRLTAQGRLETKSIDERVSSLTQGYELLSSNLATGVGVGNYLPAAFMELGPAGDPFSVQPPHFTPLLIGVELGFFGLAILLGFIFAWWFKAVWLMRRTGSASAAIIATLPVVVILVSVFDHYPYDIFAGTMLTGAVFGFFLKAGEESRA